MKKLRFSLITALAAAAGLVSCGKDEPKGPVIETESVVVTFESAKLPEAGYLLDFEYEEGDLTFSHSYTDWGDGIFSWSGFAVSDNHETTIAGSVNQFSVYGGGGADGSGQFAVCSVFGDCEFSFSGTAEYEVEYIYVNNSTYAYLAVKDGNDGGFGAVRKFAEGDWFLLTVTGYNTAGAVVGTAGFHLADFTDGKTFVCGEWTKIDLSALGKVNKIGFSLSSSDNSEYEGVTYMNTPAYFCVDNISYAKPVE